MSKRWRIKVEDIPESGFQLEADSRDKALLDLLLEVSEGSASAVSGFASVQVEPWPKRIDLTGRLSAKVPLRCARCLDGYVEQLEREFTQILARESRRGDDEEIELNSADLDRSELVGDTLDLRTVLREELLLAMPTKPLCKADCKGICGGCGAELNVAECTCAPEIDHRWAALAALKGRLES